ncbi:transcription factor MTB1 [Trifolium repens]|nr:transcription factor MTB1 [Trifolium repens]
MHASMCQYIPSLHRRLRVVARLRRWRFRMAACWPEVCQIRGGGWPMVLDEIEVDVGGSGLWNKDEKTMVVEVLGVNAFDYLVTNSVPNENLLMVIGNNDVIVN